MNSVTGFCIALQMGEKMMDTVKKKKKKENERLEKSNIRHTETSFILTNIFLWYLLHRELSLVMHRTQPLLKFMIFCI